MSLLLVVCCFSALPVIALLLYIKLYINCNHAFKVLKRHGIDGPRPSFFYGNYKERVEMGSLNFLRHLHREYGGIVGYYLGIQANISVTDLELAKRILVRDFDSFMDRPQPFPKIVFSPNGLLSARGEAWKCMRQVLSPTFSSFKMKAMTPIILHSVESLVEVFQGLAETDNSCDLNKFFRSFTLETIIAAAFGRVIEIQKGQSDELTEAAANIFNVAEETKATSVIYFNMLLSNLPWLVHILALLGKGTARNRSVKIWYHAAERIVQERRKECGEEKHKDLLQLMIDATDGEGDGEGGGKLSDSEIIGNAITFMLAAYDTTSSALSYTAYLLALNPQVQKKCQAEIDEYQEKNPEASIYQAAQDLDYLDMVLQESLRLFPPAPLFTRLCTKDYRYNDGITIPRGAVLLLPSALLHMDPEFWTDPETFDPLRFTAEEKAKRPQLCYMPFGQGPRACIGMRFAQLEAKIALMELLKRFSFVRTPETQVPLETVFGITSRPAHGIYLRVEARST